MFNGYAGGYEDDDPDAEMAKGLKGTRDEVIRVAPAFVTAVRDHSSLASDSERWKAKATAMLSTRPEGPLAVGMVLSFTASLIKPLSVGLYTLDTPQRAKLAFASFNAIGFWLEFFSFYLGFVFSYVDNAQITFQVRAPRAKPPSACRPSC